MKTKVSIVLHQFHNPKYNTSTGEGDKYCYSVIKAVNTTEPSVGDRLTKNEVDCLIRVGVTVTITKD